MNNKEYKEKIARLREIELTVKDPESSLDKIDDLITETAKIARDCYAYTRGLRDKVAELDKISPDAEPGQ